MDDWIAAVVEPDGLVLREQALRRGVTPDRIKVSLRSGGLRRVQRGVYAARGSAIDPLAVARAAVLSCGVPGAVASHHTAARVHRIATPDSPEHVIVPRGRRRARRGDLVFHGCALRAGDVAVRRGVPITTASRSLLDLASIAPRLNAVWTIDDAVRRNLVT